MATMLNTENREYITWQYQELNFALLGGLKIQGLERMRVTLKVEYKQQAVRHNPDLYNNESLDKLIRRCAERFTLGTAYMAGAFATLINMLEAYRLDQLKLLANEKEPLKQLGTAERKQAEEFLTLQGINPAVTNTLHIRGSVIINWISRHNKREVQYMAGYRYISSDEAYQLTSYRLLILYWMNFQNTTPLDDKLVSMCILAGI